jgi:hypothetical protein
LKHNQLYFDQRWGKDGFVGRVAMEYLSALL